jgi:hypothetical protein
MYSYSSKAIRTCYLNQKTWHYSLKIKLSTQRWDAVSLLGMCIWETALMAFASIRNLFLKN